jgi:spore maturation protein CgeB
MRILILDPCYPEFLRSFYADHSHVADLPYADQWRALMDQCLGTADFYSVNLTSLGHEASEIVFNSEQLQRRWASENGTRLPHGQWTSVKRKGWIPWPQRRAENEWSYTVLKAQVKHYRPDVLYVHDMNNISAAFLREMKSYVRLIVGQIACSITPGADFSQYDLVVSSLPHYVESFRAQGLESQFLRLGFGSSVLNKISPQADSYAVTHIGGYGAVHEPRNQLLEALIASGLPVACFGYGTDQLAPTSPILNVYRGEAWGIEMYNIRANSRIVVSKHVPSVAGNYANLMTLYEATGVGSLLVIDHKENLHALFEAGKEVIVYDSTEECAELIRYYLQHEEERKRIARAGQERTLKEHTYYHRMQELLDILTPYV